MKAAVVGYGVIGKHHVNILSDMGILSAVCDVDTDTLQGLEGVELYSDYIEMLDSHRPDVVHICTPHYLHAEMIIEALGRDINVLCEKPVCIREEDIPRILDAEKRSKAILGVCHQNRYNSANRYVKEYLSDKVIQGGVGQVSWNRGEDYYSSAAWRGRWDTEGGGVLINQALHTLDLMQWFCGMPDSLSANISNLTLQGKIEVEDTAVICAKGNTDFNFYASNGSPSGMPVEITVKASKKIVKLIGNRAIIDGAPIDLEAEKGIVASKSCYGFGHAPLFEDFYSCLREGRHFPIDGAEAVKVIKIILAAYKSNGKIVRL